MKKRNGFTLIELLAIIVILAIIAVITVPIILNIIDNSNKGAVTDSAYGYKDAINKFYVSKLSQNKDYTMPNKTYTVTELKTEGVTVSGKEPGSNSWVTIQNNNVTEGCLQFDEYKVEITNGQLSGAVKGECFEPLPCPGPDCVYAYYGSPGYGIPKYLKNTDGKTDEQMTLTEYTTDYTTLNKDKFLGHILDEDGKIERAFTCGIHSNGTLFCLEGTSDGSKTSTNKSILNSETLWNGECSASGGYELFCNGSSVKVYLNSNYVSISDGCTSCTIDNGYLVCGSC